MATGGAQLQQVSGNLWPPLSLAWPQFPLWFMQLCFYLAWLKAGGVGGAAFQGRSKARFFSGLPDLSCLEEEVLHGTPLGNLVAALPQPEPSTSHSHCSTVSEQQTPTLNPRQGLPRRGTPPPPPQVPHPTLHPPLSHIKAAAKSHMQISCPGTATRVSGAPPHSTPAWTLPMSLGVWERKED